MPRSRPNSSLLAMAAAYSLLAACGSGETADPGDETGPDPGAEANLAAAPAADDPAVLQARVERAMAVILRDAGSARYANIRPGVAGAVCGEVDSKQQNGRFAGMRPFVVTPEGVGLVSAKPTVAFGDPADIFPDYYVRWCASPEELTRLGPGLHGADPPPEPAPPIAFPELIDPDLPPAPGGPAPPPAAAPPRPKRPPPPRDPNRDDSFFNSVVREGE